MAAINDETQDQREHDGRQQAPREQRRDRNAGHGADGDEDEAGRNRFGQRAGRSQKRDEIAGLRAALFHLRKQHGGDGRHIGRLGAGDAGNEVHAGHQHVMQATAHRTEQARQKPHHRARHAGHFDEQAEKNEERNRQQNEVAHALIHTSDQNGERRLRGQRQIAEDGESEGKSDRHACEHGGGDHADEEDQQIEIAEPLKDRLHRPEQRKQHHDGAERDGRLARLRGPNQPERGEARHQRDPDRHRRGAQCIADLKGGRRDRRFLERIVIGGRGDESEKGERRGDGEGVEGGPRRRRQRAHDRGHAHMLVAAQRDRRAQHGEPQEEDRGELVGPDERVIEHVTRNDAGQQDDNLGRHERSAEALDEQAEPTVDRSTGGAYGSLAPVCGRGRLPTARRGHVSLPVDFSRMAQASSPYLAFHSA